MKTFTVPTREQVSAPAQAIFDNLQAKLGTVPNLYATIGYSASALQGHLEYSQTLAQGAFNAKEREAIFLAVSQVNGCDYCLAAHTALAKMNGFTEAETLELRAGTIADPRLRSISRLAAEIARTRAEPAPELLDEFFAQGSDDGALIDLIALVTEISFSNYTHKITQVPVDFPAAQPLEAPVGA